MNQKKIFSNIGWSYFLLSVITIILQFLLSFLISMAAPHLWDIPIIYWGVSLAPMYLVAMPVCAKMMKRTPKKHLYQSDIKPGRWFMILCICMFIMYAGNLIGNGVCALISYFSGLDMSMELQDVMFSQPAGMTFLFSVILAPILEELVFRKLLIDRAIVFGDKTAILLSGFLFGIFHGNFHQLFYAFGLGCILAYVYVRTGNVKYTISFHMAVNFLGGFLPTVIYKAMDLDMIMNNTGVGEMMFYLFGHLGAFVALILYGLLVLGIVITGLVFFILSVRKTELRSGEYEMPAGETAGAMFGNAGMILFIASCVFLFVWDMIP